MNEADGAGHGLKCLGTGIGTVDDAVIRNCSDGALKNSLTLVR